MFLRPMGQIPSVFSVCSRNEIVLEIRGGQVNSDERGGLIGGQTRDSELNSGEQMLAGVGSVAGGRTPAKPPWSEVMIFFDLFLRQINIAVTTRAQQKRAHLQMRVL